MRKLIASTFELVLGRKTYQIFEAYWPYQGADNPIAKSLNAAKKHVASRTLTTLHWNNSTLLRGDVVPAITALKAQPGPDLQMIGSGNLIQTLQAASLIDEYNVWIFPVGGQTLELKQRLGLTSESSLRTTREAFEIREGFRHERSLHFILFSSRHPPSRSLRCRGTARTCACTRFAQGG